MYISVLCEEYRVKYVPHTNPSHIHFGDGVHLSNDGGIALYVRKLKEIFNPLLGVKDEQRNEPRNNNPMKNRNMRNNQTEMQSYNRFDGGYWRCNNNNNSNNWKNDEFYQDFDCNNSYNKDINMRLLRLALGFR